MKDVAPVDAICLHIMTTITEGSVEVKPDTRLIETGILDSANVVELLEFVERQFGVVIPPDDADPVNLETPAAAAELVTRLLAAHPS